MGASSGRPNAASEHAFDNFASFFEASPMARFRRERRDAGALPVRMILAEQEAHADDDAATPDLVVGLVLGGRAAARWRWGGPGTPWNATPARRPGELGLSPVHTTGTFEVAGPSRMLLVALPLAALRARLAPDAAVPTDFGALHDAYYRSAFDRDLCLRMWRAAGEGPSPLTDLLVDACAQTLVLSFAARAAASANSGRHAAPLAPRRPQLPRPLAAAAARRVEEAIRTLPAGAVTNAALAAAAGLPDRTFRAQFRARFGMAPHQYVLAARVAAARDLLRGTARPLAEIAAALGFAHQAHFSRVFTQHVGTSPGRYRGHASAGTRAR